MQLSSDTLDISITDFKCALNNPMIHLKIFFNINIFFLHYCAQLYTFGIKSLRRAPDESNYLIYPQHATLTR